MCGHDTGVASRVVDALVQRTPDSADTSAPLFPKHSPRMQAVAKISVSGSRAVERLNQAHFGEV